MTDLPPNTPTEGDQPLAPGDGPEPEPSLTAADLYRYGSLRAETTAWTVFTVVAGAVAVVHFAGLGNNTPHTGFGVLTTILAITAAVHVRRTRRLPLYRQGKAAIAQARARIKETSR